MSTYHLASGQIALIGPARAHVKLLNIIFATKKINNFEYVKACTLSSENSRKEAAKDDTNTMTQLIC